MKNIIKQFTTALIMLTSICVSGQYFSEMSDAFNVDTDPPDPSCWCIAEGDYLMPGQEVYLEYSMWGEENFLSLELGFSSEEDGDMIILGELPFPGPANITVPEVDPTPFARFYLIGKDTYGHIGIEQIPYEGYFNVGAAETIIDVPAGWSGISNPYFPVDPSINNILADHLDDVIIMQDMENVFWPGGNLFTLTDWEIFKGYLIKAENPYTLTLEGTSMNQCIWYGFTMPEGWGLFSVAGNCDLDAQMFFDWNLWTSVMIKEAAGWRVLWPEYGINTIEILERGKSYYIYSNFPNEDWTFSPCWGQPFKHSFEQPQTPKAWNEPVASPTSHVIAIPPSAYDTDKLPADAIIGAFTQDGICAGVAGLASKHITVFGDDPSTENQEGFTGGEIMYFKVLNPETNIEMEAIPQYNPSVGNSSGTFAVEGFSAITSLELKALGMINQFSERLAVFPNPANNKVEIKINSNDEFQLDLINIKGEIVYSSGFTGKIQLGLHEFAKGLYTVKISNNDTIMSRKLVIN